MHNKNILSNNHALKTIHLAKRKIKIMYSLSILICLSLITFIIYYQIKSSYEKKLATEFALIEDIYNQEDVIYQDRLQESKKFQNKYSNLEEIEPDYSKSMEKFLEFALKYPKNEFAWQASIRASDYYIKNEKLQEAQKALEAVLPYTSKYSWVQIKLRTTLAGIYATQKNTDKAIEQLNIVEQYPHNPIQNQSRLLKAQIYIANKNLPEAKKILNQIISTPKSTLDTQSKNDFQSDELDINHQALVLLNRIGL